MADLEWVTEQRNSSAFIRIADYRHKALDDQAAEMDLKDDFDASAIEQLDTHSSDGSNIRLDGPDTLIGYYGGVGEPNDYLLMWLDEYLYHPGSTVVISSGTERSGVESRNLVPSRAGFILPGMTGGER